MMTSQNSRGSFWRKAKLHRLMGVTLAIAMLLCLFPLSPVMAAGTDYTVVESHDPLFMDEGELTVRFTIRDENGNEIKTFCGEYGKKPAVEGMQYESVGMAPQEAALAFALAHETFGAGVSDAEFNQIFGTSLSGIRRLNMMHSVVWYFMGSGHPLSGVEFNAIVGAIESMVRAYNNRVAVPGGAITVIDLNYNADTGAMTFGYSGYTPENDEMMLTWSGDTDGLSVTISGRRLASGAMITAGDTILVEYTGYGQVEFTLTNVDRFLQSGSLFGEVFAPVTVPDGVDISELNTYQKIVTGNAAFGILSGTLSIRNELPEGDLTVKKALAGNNSDWGVNNSTIFRAKIMDSVTGKYLTLTGTAPNYTYSGMSPTGSEFSFSVGQPATIKGIPSGTVCIVEETISENAHYSANYSGNGAAITTGGNATVTVTNTYEHGVGNLIINKVLNGSYSDWGADESTVFRVRVKDATHGYYLSFSGTWPVYTCTGVSNGTGDIIVIRAGEPTIVKDLWANVRYEVEEISGANYAISYQGNGAMFNEGQNSTVTIVNTYERGTGGLVINKRLAGSYADWGVDESTEFLVRVKDATNNNYLRFTGTGPVYTCIGNSGSSDSNTGDIIRISAGQPVSIQGLWANVMYEVEEIDGAHYAISYQGNGVMFTEDQNNTVTVINTYEHGTGDLIINKRLAGSYTDWGVDESTVFYAKVKDTTKNNYLLFKTTPEADGKYRCVGNSVDGLSEPYTGATTLEVPFRAGQPLIITNLWVGAVYEAEEVGNSRCATDYIGNGAIYTEGQNCNITVVNTYEHGTGALIINKKLAGSYIGWGVDSSSTFSVRVKDMTGGNYLLFKSEPEADGSFKCIGNDVDGLTELYDGTVISELIISAGRPLVVVNLWVNHTYKIEEAADNSYTIDYMNNGAVFQDGQNSTVTVVNTYKPDIPDEPHTPGKPNEPGTPNIPKTGDTRTHTVAVILLILGVGCIAGAEWYRKYRVNIHDGKA